MHPEPPETGMQQTQEGQVWASLKVGPAVGVKGQVKAPLLVAGRYGSTSLPCCQYACQPVPNCLSAGWLAYVTQLPCQSGFSAQDLRFVASCEASTGNG